MLIALLIVGVLVVAGFGVLGFVVLFKVDRDQRKAELNAEPQLDALFDGTEIVTFAGNARSLKYETVIVGAKKRGYALETQGGNPKGAFTLIFTKLA